MRSERWAKLLSWLFIAWGVWGLYRDVALPLHLRGVGCLCAIYLSWNCLYQLPPLLTAPLKIGIGVFLLRRRPGWAARTSRWLEILLLLQAITLLLGPLMIYRLAYQADAEAQMPASVWIASAVIVAIVQLLEMGITWWLLRMVKPLATNRPDAAGARTG